MLDLIAIGVAGVALLVSVSFFAYVVMRNR